MPRSSGCGSWVGTWSTAQAGAAAAGRSRSGFRDQTIRNIVRASAGGSAVRIRLSNVFGAVPLTVSGTHVALRLAGAATAPGTTRAVTFGGGRAVTVPAGRRVLSDPVPLEVGDGADLAVSLFLGDPTGPASWHPAGLTTSYLAGAGDHGADADAAAFTRTDRSWYFLDGVDVLNPAVTGAVVAFGPSTTDGIGSAPDANRRYPDELARRLLRLPAGERMTVLNAGIAGNKLLTDDGTRGPSALNRFARDALGQAGLRAVILWEGTNDVATRPGLPLSAITGAYQRLIAAARARGVRIVGATLQPHEGAGFYSPAGNRLREAVNDWIRWSGAFDDVADFDWVLQDPRHPRRLLPAFDSGDHLHPNEAGYRAIAEAVEPGPSRWPDRGGRAYTCSMARYFDIHPANPQRRAVGQVADVVRAGGVIAYPTDSCYALGCQLGNAAGIDRIRSIRGVDDKHHLTFVCQDFAQLGRFVVVPNGVFRAIKAATPGSYTFILAATKEVPRRLQHPGKKTVGVRIPGHRVTQALLAELGEPLVSSTLLLPGQDDPLTQGWEINQELGPRLDAVVDSGDCGTEPTTVIDFSGDEPEIVRRGAGDPAAFEG